MSKCSKLPVLKGISGAGGDKYGSQKSPSCGCWWTGWKCGRWGGPGSGRGYSDRNPESSRFIGAYGSRKENGGEDSSGPAVGVSNARFKFCRFWYKRWRGEFDKLSVSKAADIVSWGLSILSRSLIETRRLSLSWSGSDSNTARMSASVFRSKCFPKIGDRQTGHSVIILRSELIQLWMQKLQNLWP